MGEVGREATPRVRSIVVPGVGSVTASTYGAGREATPVEVLVKGLRKAVADPETEWVDASIVRLLLDRYEEADRG